MIKLIQTKTEELFKNRSVTIGVASAITLFLLVLPLLMGVAGDNDDGAILSFLKGNAWAEFLGVFHPLILHLPIGVLILIFSMEVINLVTKDYKMDMRLPLVFNAAASVLAALLGILWYYGGDWSQSELLDDHMWTGVIYAVCAVWLPFVYTGFFGKFSGKGAYYGVLLGSVGMMTVAAHHGGESTHGDPFDKAPWKEKEKKRGVKPTPDEGDPVDELIDPLVFDDVVVPIFAEKCYACHHSDKKIKSKFKMDTFADLMKGGAEQEFAVALTPGDPSNSTIITYIELPIDDDLHMPPENKTQITDDELKVLKWWVKIGAPDQKKLSEVEVPEDIEAIIGSAKLEIAQTDVKEEPKPKEPKVTPKNSPLAPAVAEFLKKYPNALSWTSLSDSTLYFSAASSRMSYTDEDLAALEPFVSELTELNLSDTKVTDAVASLVKKCAKLQVLKLANTQVSDSFVKELGAHPTLEVLVLHSTTISDDVVMDIAAIPNLKKVFLWNSKVTKEGVDKLKKAVPGLEVNSGL